MKQLFAFLTTLCLLLSTVSAHAESTEGCTCFSSVIPDWHNKMISGRLQLPPRRNKIRT